MPNSRTPPHRARWLWVSGLFIALAVLAAACNGGQGAGTGPTSSPIAIDEEKLQPVVLSSDLTVGANRFVLGLLQEGQAVLGAQVHLSFFQQAGDDTPRAETDATPISITRTFTETHADGTLHTHEAGEIGVYVANPDFDAAGQWRLEATVSADGDTIGPLEAQFDVREKSISPAIGDPAPRSRQTILADVDGDIAKIDTSDPPDPDMHDTTITDAATSGKPVVIAFASPAFCRSQICGPVKQVVDQLYEQHKDRVTFIHVEPFSLDEARSGEGLVPVPTLEEWRLVSEPWVFVVDSEGKIAAKFEGIVSADELTAAVQDVLGASGGGY